MNFARKPSCSTVGSQKTSTLAQFLDGRLADGFQAQTDLFDKRSADGFRELAELIDRLFAYRFEEFSQCHDASLARQLESIEVDLFLSDERVGGKIMSFVNREVIVDFE